MLPRPALCDFVYGEKPLRISLKKKLEKKRFPHPLCVTAESLEVVGEI